jgi:hypothetical protein
VPTTGVACVGVGIYSNYLGVVNYLIDADEKYAAALSAASLGRNNFGAFLPLARYQLFITLGFGWAGSLLGFMGLALSVVLVVSLIKGPTIRRRSPFLLEAIYDENKGVERPNNWAKKEKPPPAQGAEGGSGVEV